jgi:hypothetical protein
LIPRAASEVLRAWLSEEDLIPDGSDLYKM